MLCVFVAGDQSLWGCLKGKESEGKKSLTPDGRTYRTGPDLPCRRLLGGCICRSGEEDVHDGTKHFCPFAEGREFFCSTRFLSITKGMELYVRTSFVYCGMDRIFFLFIFFLMFTHNFYLFIYWFVYCYRNHFKTKNRVF
jgi:hypothetical protein